MTEKTVIVTGATGYIGSHMLVELLDHNYNVVSIDDLSNSSIEVLSRIENLCGKTPIFEKIDIRDTSALIALMKTHTPNAVLHFAGVKSVKESVFDPLKYFDINVTGTASLLQAMHECQVNQLIFSSSCTVYGDPESVPVNELTATNPINAYGRTKEFAEHMIKDLAFSNPDFSAISLRYFNPIGAHPSGKIGELPGAQPENLLPYVVQVAKGVLPQLSVFGDDYDTDDGTCVRDYIHVMDLVRGHLDGLKLLDKTTGMDVINLGTGTGYSVLQVIDAFNQVSGLQIPYSIEKRRPGDAAVMYADASKAHRVLDWKATCTLHQMCEDHWRWGQSSIGQSNR